MELAWRLDSIGIEPWGLVVWHGGRIWMGQPRLSPLPYGVTEYCISRFGFTIHPHSPQKRLPWISFGGILPSQPLLPRSGTSLGAAAAAAAIKGDQRAPSRFVPTVAYSNCHAMESGEKRRRWRLQGTDQMSILAGNSQCSKRWMRFFQPTRALPYDGE